MKKKQTILFYILFVLFTSNIYAQFAGGNGTDEDPYLVGTADQLNIVRDYLDSSFRQISHIDLNVAPYNIGDGWDPIGNYENSFSGVYNGQGFIISNGYINRPTESVIGLFSSIDGENTEIFNLGIKNISVVGFNAVGGFVGANNDATIADCFCTGSVTGIDRVGGFVGFNSGVISNCYSTVNVIGEDLIGGLIADNDWGTIVNSYWDLDASGQTSSQGGEGRTTDEMTFPYAVNTYVNWDFDSLWEEDIEGGNDGYPNLTHTVGIIDNNISKPEDFLLNNYPNPFNPTTTITYNIPVNGLILLRVYNVRGQLVRNLLNKHQSAGQHVLIWDGNNNNGIPVASGFYFCKLSSSQSSEYHKMLLMK